MAASAIGADAWSVLVVSSDTRSSAASARRSRPHSRRTCRVQAWPQPGAVGSAPEGRAACSGRPAVLALAAPGVVTLGVSRRGRAGHDAAGQLGLSALLTSLAAA